MDSVQKSKRSVQDTILTVHTDPSEPSNHSKISQKRAKNVANESNKKSSMRYDDSGEGMSAVEGSDHEVAMDPEVKNQRIPSEVSHSDSHQGKSSVAKS